MRLSKAFAREGDALTQVRQERDGLLAELSVLRGRVHRLEVDQAKMLGAFQRMGADMTECIRRCDAIPVEPELSRIAENRCNICNKPFKTPAGVLRHEANCKERNGSRTQGE